MKKIFLTITLALVCIVGFANNESQVLNKESNSNIEKTVKKSDISLEYLFSSIEQLKMFDTSKISEMDFSSFDNGEDDCEVTGSVTVTVSADIGVPGFGGIEVSASITLSVTASCAEIADALSEAASTARRIAMAQLAQ
ncbi:hypothetical protein [Kordia sp.]|uniref:hypothetical protein n=1 Tax=Kordia sp. TaxID=1965332 RepID=UPI003D27226B